MLGIVLNLPPGIEHYLATTPWPEMASQALLFLGWIPIFGVLIWGFTQVWIDYKQGQYFEHLHWVLLQVSVPQGSINTPKGMENFFNNLAGAKSALTWKETRLMGKFQAYFSFEIVSTEGNVRFYIRCQDKHRDMVEASLYAQYPEAQISEAEDYVGALPDKYPNDTHKVFGGELSFAKPDYYPLRTYIDFEHTGEKDQRFKDPILNTIELMGKMGKNEHLWMQFIIMPPEEQDWAKDGEKYLNKMMGKEEKHKPGMTEQVVGSLAGFGSEFVKQTTGLEIGGGGHHDEKSDDFRMFKMTPTERTLADGIAQKISKIGWMTKIRVLYAGPSDAFRKPLMASSIKGIFHPYGHLNMNKLGLHAKSVPKDDYFWMEWQMYGKMYKLVKRYKHRLLGQGATPNMLNSEELATLFHFPAADARTPVLATSMSRRGEAPLALPVAGADEADMVDWEKTTQAKKGHDELVEEPGALTVPMPHVAPGRATVKEARPELSSGIDSPRHEDAIKAATISMESKPLEREYFGGQGEFPQPGRPAPLPPGMDLRPEPLSDDDDAPTNLPVL